MNFVPTQNHLSVYSQTYIRQLIDNDLLSRVFVSAVLQTVVSKVLKCNLTSHN